MTTILTGDPPAAPRVVDAFMQSGHGRAGQLIDWWRSTSDDICVLVKFSDDPTPQFELSVFKENIGSWAHDLNGYTLTLEQLQQALVNGRMLRGAEWRADDAAIDRLKSACADLSMQRILRQQKKMSTATLLLVLDRDPMEQDYLFAPASIARERWESMVTRVAEDYDIKHMNLDGDPVQLPAAAGVVFWAACQKDCVREQTHSTSTDTFFADLEARPPPWPQLSAAARPAWEAFIGLGGVSGPPRPMPWWLDGARRSQDCFAGILSPAEARLITRHAPELQALFAGHGLAADAAQFLATIGRAAAGDTYCIAWERGT